MKKGDNITMNKTNENIESHRTRKVNNNPAIMDLDHLKNIIEAKEELIYSS